MIMRRLMCFAAGADALFTGGIAALGFQKISNAGVLQE
jgi:hypothetical protein